MAIAEHSSTSAPLAPEYVTLPRSVVYAVQFALAQTSARLGSVACTPPGRIDETILANARAALIGLNAAVARARGDGGSHLTFDALRAANRARMPQFRNARGALVHAAADGSDYAPAQWLQALVGEIGEYANLRKKFERGDMPEPEFRVEAAKEIADVQCYLDVLAAQLGIDLGQATMDKFNEVSERVASDVRLLGDRWESVAPIAPLQMLLTM